VDHLKRGRCSPRLPASASCLSPQLSKRSWEAGEQSRLSTLQEGDDGNEVDLIVSEDLHNLELENTAE